MTSVNTKVLHSTSENDVLKCFICGAKILDRYSLLSSTKSHTSGLKITEVLSRLIGELYYVVVSEHDVICRCCTSLLNTYDKLESMKSKLRSIVRRNLDNNYLAKQECTDIETNKELFPAKFDAMALANCGQTGSAMIQNNMSGFVRGDKERKSTMQTAFEALQFDLNEFPVCSSSNFQEQINVTYSTVPHIIGVFPENDIDPQMNTLTDIDMSYINDELSLLPSESSVNVTSCSLDDFQRNLLQKTDMNELLSLNSSNNNSTLNHVMLTDFKSNVPMEQSNNKESRATDDSCLSDEGELITSDFSSTAENFFVQIVHETGETSQSVLTLDGSSTQVLKQNWEDVCQE